MAYVLKTGHTWIDQYGVTHTGDGTNAASYAIIDNATIDKQRKAVRFSISLYVSRAARAANNLPLRIYEPYVTDPDYTTYFTTANQTLWTQIQNWLVAKGLSAQTDLVTTDWQVDGQAEP